MKTRSGFAAVLALLVTVPVSGQMVTGLHVLPVAIHSPGVAPSFWKTDVFATNYNDHEMKVGFLFFPEGQANTLTFTVPAAQTRRLAAGATLIVEDIVFSMFGQSNAKGMLFVISDLAWFPSNEPNSEKLAVTSRTYNTGSDPRGTFGQTATNMLLYLNFKPVSSWLTGLRYDSSFRCNLGIGNVGPNKIKVHYRVRRDSGALAAEGSKEILAYSMGQWGLASLGVAQGAGPLSVELWLDSQSVTANYCAGLLASSNGFYAYASPVDGAGSGQGTGDGEMVYAVPASDLQVLECTN